jgi:hypothetical protein
VKRPAECVGLFVSGEVPSRYVDPGCDDLQAPRQEWIRSAGVDPGRIPADANRSQQIEGEEHKGSEALKNREQIDNRHVVSSSTHQ